MPKKLPNNISPHLQPALPIKAPDKTFYKLPDSTASNLILETLGAGENIADLPARKRQISRAAAMEVLEKEKSRRITLQSTKAQITLELSSIDKLTGTNKSAKKLFVFALIKANEQALHNGQLTQDYVTFSLQELVDIGFYSSLRSARTGFQSGADTLTSLKIKGHIQKSPEKDSTIDTLEVLFTGAKIEKNQCFLRLNYTIDWQFVAQYFTILPRYYFRLSNRGSDLLYYIFYIARQKTREIEEKGYFTISFRALQQRLQLPSETANNNPYRTIKKPIEDAIEELETEHNNYYNNTDFRLLPVYSDTAPLADFLNNGYLKVELKGAFGQAFKTISKNTAKKIKTSQNHETPNNTGNEKEKNET